MASIAGNAGFVFGGRVADGVVAMAAGVILARSLGPKELGDYSFAFAFIGFFGLLVDLGARDIVTRDVARDPSCADRVVGAAMALRMLASIVTIGLVNLVAHLLSYAPPVRLLIGIASLSFLPSYSSLYLSGYQAFMRMGYPALVNLITGSAKCAAFGIIAWCSGSVRVYALATLGLAWLSCYLLRQFSRGFVRPAWRADTGLWGRLLRESWPLLLTQALALVYYRADQIMIYSMLEPEELGYYSTAVRIVEALRMVPIALFTPVFAVASGLYEADREGFEALCLKACRLSLVLSAAGAVLLCLGGDLLVPVLFGSRFVAATRVLPVLACAEIFAQMHMMNVSVLIASRSQRFLVLVTLCSAVGNVILNLLWIPRGGILGAAAASLVAYALLPLSLLLFGVSRRLYARMLGLGARAMALGGVAVAAGWLIRRQAGGPAMLSAAAGCAVYAMGVLAWRDVRADMAMVLRRWTRGRGRAGSQGCGPREGDESPGS